MHGIHPRLARLASIVAASVAALIGAGVPLSYGYFAWTHQAEQVRADSETRAQMLSELIPASPETWQSRLPAINAVLSRRMYAEPIDRHRVFAADGRLLAETRFTPAPAAPTLTHSLPVLQGGAVVGRLEAEQSLRPRLIETLEVALIAAAFALALFGLLRAVPLRALRNAADQAFLLANHDPLTGLPNRLLFRDRLDQALRHIDDGGEPAALLLLDLDRFNAINDSLGQDAGDRLLQQVAKRLQACIRRTDTVARLGGDAFAIIQFGVGDPQVAYQLARRIADALAAPFELDGRHVCVGTSIGVMLCTRTGADDADDCLRDAEVALFRAKSLGRGHCCFFEQAISERLQMRQSSQQEMRKALLAQQFEAHYQPQYSLCRGTLVGVEALARWRHPQRGLLAPSAFIPLAEETGLIGMLGEQVLRLACRDSATWGDLRVAVNLSPAQFRHPGLTAMVASVLAETGFNPRRLELEIPEGVLLHDLDANLATLRALQALGVRIAMDNFGIGCSSLACLCRLPLDRISIDRSFVHDLGEDDGTAAMIDAVVALSHSLGTPVTAEGVETREQVHLLRRAGCDEGQGYLFGRPMPAAEMLQRLVPPQVLLLPGRVAK